MADLLYLEQQQKKESPGSYAGHANKSAPFWCWGCSTAGGAWVLKQCSASTAGRSCRVFR